jgi:two-component system, response regulator
MNRRTILLVEDNEDDVELARYALGLCRVPTQVVAMPTGEAALAYLRRARGDDGEEPRPDLVLLDLQLPGISGLEVLRRVRAEPDIRRTLIVVLTTSDDHRDITASYDLGVNSYIRKPVDLGAFTAVVDQLGSYWLQTNTSPPL